MSQSHRPLALIILDGWGYRENSEHNAILAANTPNWDTLWADYPHTLLNASGNNVGLPDAQMGNSEVGHLHMGSGRIIYQELTRINRAIEDSTFFDNELLCNTVDAAKVAGKAVHILGLLSPGGVHSHDQHIQAMVKLAAQRGAKEVYVHAFLDGRDTPPRSALGAIEAMEAVFAELGVGRFASVVGRFYAMDRDQRWERVEQAYRLITDGEGDYQVASAAEALANAYARDENDEFVKATVIGGSVAMQDNDAVIFMNFRADRAREMTLALTDENFDGFSRPRPLNLASIVTLTEYKADFPNPVAFPNSNLNNVLGECLAKQGQRQLRIAETEKYAHVTFFFNGGEDTPFEGEDRILIPSPKVETYDLQPEMSAPEVTEKLVAAIESGDYDAIICNFANADMVGHSGNFDAAVKAVEALDMALGQVWQALQKVGGEMLVTADHGNVELMYDQQREQAHTAHTCEPVPFIYAGRSGQCAETGCLSDIAPTMLSLMELTVPEEMQEQAILVNLD